MTIADPIQLIISLLQADTAVDALVDGRVGREVPAEDADVMPRACVIVKPVGGPGRPGLFKVRGNRIDTVCYGATLAESWQLHLAVREALETFEHDGDLLTIHTTSDGTNARDPVKQWPVCYASYIVRSAA